MERIPLRLEKILKRRALGKTDVNKLLRRQSRYYSAKAADAEDFYDRRLRDKRIDKELKNGYLKVAALLQQLVKPGQTLLDLACGIGFWSCLAAKRGAEVVSVDQSTEVLKRTERRARLNGIRVKTVCASVLGPLPFENERFDGVIMTWLLAHIPRRAAVQLLQEVHRLAKPSAWLLIADSRWRRQPGGKEQLQVREAARKTFSVYKYYYTLPELKRLLNETGWKTSRTATSKYELFTVAVKKGY